MKHRIVLLCSAIVLCAASCDYEASETGAFSLDASTFDVLYIETINGNIDVNNGSGGNTVPVDYVKKAHAFDEATANNNLTRIKIDRALEGRTYKIVVTIPPDVNGGVDFTLSNFNDKRVILKSSNGTVNCETIAGGEINTANGDVTVARVLADVTITSPNGTVTVIEAGDRVTVSSTSGNVNVRKSGTGILNGAISTTNGSVTLDLSDDLSSRVQMSTMNGFVIVAGVPLGKNAERVLGQGLGLLDVDVVNGNISLNLF